MATRYKREPRKDLRIITAEDMDSAEGWFILRKFKSKAALAMWVNNPDNIADLEYRYPLHNYRRKLDLDSLYVAVLRR